MTDLTVQAEDKCVLVFDSGLGGLSVLGPLQQSCAGARFVYAADNQGFPYGAKSPPDRPVCEIDRTCCA
jgi:glutamate racemase